MANIFSDDDDPDLSPQWLARSRVNELTFEALLESELVGNNYGARLGLWGSVSVPDEPVFYHWLGEFSRHLPSYLELVWSHKNNVRYAGYEADKRNCMLKLESSEIVKCADDIKPTPKEAAKLLLKKYPPHVPGYYYHPYVGFVK